MNFEEREREKEGESAHVAKMEEDGSALKILTNKPMIERPLRKSRYRYKGNIRIEDQEININMRNYIDLGQDKDYWQELVNVVLNFQVL
jgi:hypothetical protein